LPQKHETVVIDRGFLEIKARIREAIDSHVDVGIFQGQSNQDGQSILAYAIVNEFGTNRAGASRNVRIPARPFVKLTALAKEDEYRTLLRRAAQEILANKSTVVQELYRFGAHAASDIQQTIINYTDPPNAESTQLAKGANLKNTRQGRRMLKEIRKGIAMTKDSRGRFQKKQAPKGLKVNNPLVDNMDMARAVMWEVTINGSKRRTGRL
jgi:hypothetical protein